MTARQSIFARSAFRTADRLIRYGTIVVLVSGASCPKAQVEIYPNRLHAEAMHGASVNVLVAAHYRGKNGLLLPNGISWKKEPATAPFSFTPASGGLITLTLDPNVPAGTEGRLIATADGKSATTVIRFVAPNADIVRADRPDFSFPSVALLSGKDGGCKAHELNAFAGVADLGDWTSGPCVFTERMVVFTQNAAPKFYSPYTWQPAPPPDVFDETTGAPVLQTMPVARPAGFTNLKLKVFALGTDVNEVQSRFDEQVSVAFARYTEALAGIYFESDGTITAPVGPEFANVDECETLYDILSAHPDLADPGSLNLYYVKRIVWSYRGLWCSKPTDAGPDPRNLILMSMTNYATTTLGHEVGHALAQSEPWAWRGHAQLVKGMSSDNLMWGNLEDGQADSRWRLGVGQVFRMYQDQRSWFNSSAIIPTGLDCGCNPYKNLTCPKLSSDVTDIADKGAKITGATCPP